MKKLIFILSLVLLFNTSYTFAMLKSLSDFIVRKTTKEISTWSLENAIRDNDTEKAKHLLRAIVQKVITNNGNPNRIKIEKRHGECHTPLLNQAILLDDKHSAQELLNLPKTNPNISLSVKVPGYWSEIRSNIPLNVAIKDGNIEVVQMLLNHPHINPNQQNSNGNTPLGEAIDKRRTGIVQMLLDHPRTNPNQQNSNGNTPLHKTISLENVPIIHILLNHPNIDVSRHDNDGNTPLHKAVSLENGPILQILLNHPNIDVNRQNNDGNTPLHKAIHQQNGPIVQMLLNRPNVDVNRQDKDGNTPLHKAIHQQSGIILKLLDCPNIDVNLQDKDGNTPLHKAIPRQNGPLIKILLNCQADLNKQNNDGNTPLHEAIYQGEQPVVQILLNYQANLLNQLNRDDRTPLHIAIRQVNEPIIQMLLSLHADLNQQDKYGNTPLDLAAKLKIEGNTVRERIIKTVAIHSLFSAIEKADYEKIAQAMKYGAIINIQRANGDTPMHVALRLGNLEIVEYLLQFRPNLYIKNNNGENVLQLVIGHNNNQILKHIFLKSAFSCTEELPFEEISNDAISSDDIETLNWILKKYPEIAHDIKNQLLFQAIYQGRPNITRLLLKNGAAPNAVSENGDSCLHLAAHQGDKEIVEILLEHGADPHKTNVNDATSFEIAKKQDHNDIVISMLKHKKSSIFNRLFKSIITPFHLAGQKSMRILTKLGLSRGYTPIKFLIKCLHFWK